jgi:hypothetical protein
MGYFLFVILALLFFSNFGAEVKVSQKSNVKHILHHHVIHSEIQRSPFLLSYVRMRDEIIKFKKRIEILNYLIRYVYLKQARYSEAHGFRVPYNTDFIEEQIARYEHKISRRLKSLKILSSITSGIQRLKNLSEKINKFLADID